MELHAEGPGRCLQASRLGIGIGISRVDEDSHDGRRGDQLVQQLQPLGPQLHVQRGHAGEVAAGSVQAGDKSSRDRIATGLEDDRNRRGRCLGRRYRWAIRGNHGDLTANQIGRQCRQSIVLAIRPAKFDRHVVALDIARFAQAFPERAYKTRVLVRRSAVEEADNRQGRLLSARRERPRGRAAEQRDELAPLHVEHGVSFPSVPSLVAGRATRWPSGWNVDRQKHDYEDQDRIKRDFRDVETPTPPLLYSLLVHGRSPSVANRSITAGSACHRTAGQVLGANLKCSESRWVPTVFRASEGRIAEGTVAGDRWWKISVRPMTPD